MKKFLIVALLAFSAIGVASFNTAIYKEQGGAKMVVGSGGELEVQAGATIDLQSGASLEMTNSADGLSAAPQARVTYDTAVDGGGIGARGLGVTLPANAIVKNSLYQVITQFADSGSGTVALSCGSATILSAGDITSASSGTVVEGTIDTTAEAADVGSSACELTATVATATQTAGKLVLFVDYVVSE